MRILPYRTLENVIEGAVMTFVDITRRKEIEAALKRSEILLRTAQRYIRIGGWEWDIEKKAPYWTEEMYRIHDLDPKESLVGMSAIERTLKCLSTKDRPLLQVAFDQCAEEGKSFDFEFLFTTAKGRSLKVRAVGEPVLENGRVVRVVGFIMDITGRT